VIDADLRTPSLHRFFEVPRAPGLVDVFGNGLKVDAATHRLPWLGELEILTAGSPTSRAGEVLMSEGMESMLEWASQHYDRIVVDAPPILPGSDAASLAARAGTAVVLVVAQSAKRRVVERALRELELIEGHVLGVVTNRAGRLAAHT
jgi:Mrp family chromosome partitioning ATPase